MQMFGTLLTWLTCALQLGACFVQPFTMRKLKTVEYFWPLYM